MSDTKYFPTVEAIEKAAHVLDEILEPTPFQRNATFQTSMKLKSISKEKTSRW